MERRHAVGFIGLGRMGEPMARNLLRAGHNLIVWNRSRPALDRLCEAGAHAAGSAREVLRTTPVTLLMLANEAAADLVLERGATAFLENVERRLLIQMGTTSPGYSAGLEQDILAVNGRYVEAPVSGSRAPAEEGSLVGMLAGDRIAVDEARSLVSTMCRELFDCGPVPNALSLKLAVNLFLITMVTGLAEAAHLASRSGVDPVLFQAALDAGPMASAVSRMKLAKLRDENFVAQASIADVWMNARLVADAARAAGAAAPLLEQSKALFEVTHRLGHGQLDMIAVVRGLQALSQDQGL